MKLPDLIGKTVRIEREEVENATHISGLGNGVGWENPEEVKVGREKQADLEQLSLNSMKCL